MLDAIANSNDNLGRPMPAYPQSFPIDGLMRVESQVRTLTEGELRDGLSLLSPEINDQNDDPESCKLILDWKEILMSFRARKLKDHKLARLHILSAKFQGYHFFTR